MSPHQALILSFAIALSGARGLDAQDLTRQQMEEDLQQLTDALRSRWAYLDDKRENFGVDVEELHAGTRARLRDTLSKVDFLRLLEEHVASLKDGHASVYAPGVYTVEGKYVPFYLRETEEGFAMAYRPEGAPEGVDKGDLVLRWDHKTTEEHIQEEMRRTCASTDMGRRHRAISRLTVKEDRFQILPAGEEDPIWVDWVRPEGKPPDPDADPPFLSHEIIEDGIGYLKVFTFQPRPKEWSRARPEDADVLREWDRILAGPKREIREAMEALSGTKALILDLRYNPGGTDLLGRYLAQHLVRTPAFIYYFLGDSDRKSPTWVRPDKGIGRYEGKLVLIINEGCFSAADNLAACLAVLHPEIRIVGRPTHGGTGAPVPVVTLEHSGAVVTVCSIMVWKPGGGLIEGRGTKPDVLVRWTQKDIVEGRDADLEAALVEARKALPRRRFY